MDAHRKPPLGRRILFTTLFLLFLAVSRPSAAQVPIETRALQQVAEREGLPIGSLTVAELETRTLSLTDQQITQVKVIDERTGEVYRFETGSPDAGGALQAEATAYRDAYGALHPNLARRLSTMAEDEMLTVGIWLRTPDLTALPRPDLGHEMSTVERGDAAPPARDAGSPTGPDAPGEKRDAAQPLSPTRAPVQDEIETTLEAADAANRQHLADQVAAVRAPLLADLDARGIQPVAVSPTAPLIYVTVPKSEILSLAQRPDVDTVYPPNDNADLMVDAKPTQKADVVEAWGYEGTGISVAILEDSRIEFDNPHLDLGGSSLSDTVRDPTDSNVDQHATATGGMVASQHGTQEGIAQGVDLYSANATTYNDGDLSDAMDWAVSKHIDIINNSWGGNVGNTNLNEHDRHLDYIVRYEVDSVTVAAGNEANTCGNGTGRVASPARGYNVISVGGYNDQNSTTWDDDTTYVCSSFVDPSSGVQKPEVAASGANIVSTSDNSSDWIESAGSGTSYAAPMVAAEAALLLERDTSLKIYPETVKAIIMATALHNIEGDTELSDIDGAGGVDMRAAFHLVDEGWWDWDNVQESDFPYTYTQYAYAGETVRAVIAWNSNPTSDYSSDSLEADLELRAYDGDGDFLTASTSFNNSYEIVEFTAPTTGYYRFRISEFTFAGTNEFVGFAFWPGHRGLTAYDPEVYDTPPISHDNYRITAAAHWNAAGIRIPSGHDYDLYLYDGSPFGDPDDHTWLEDSTLGGDTLDFVVLDGNHAPLEDYFLEAETYSGSGGTYEIEWATHSATLQDGTYGPYSMMPTQVLRVWDLPITGGEDKRVLVRPTNGNIDLGLALFETDGSDAGTWYQGRSQAIASVDENGLDDGEMLTYTATDSDTYGLVAWSNAATTTSDFMLYVDSTPPTGDIHLEGALAYANSTGVTVNINVADGDTTVTEMRFSNDGTAWSAWEPFSSSKSWTLPSGDGTKTVYAQFRNTVGLTATLSDSIILDTAPPTTSASSPASSESTAFTVSWSGSDGSSGIADYDVQYRVGSGGSWTNWRTGTTDTSDVFGPTAPVTVARDQTYYFRVRARDHAGNVSGYSGGNGDTQTLVELFDVFIPLVIR